MQMDMVQRSHAADCSVLAELARATAIHNWTYKGGWLNGTNNCCAWELVGCDERGRVKVLALSFNGLVGVLPASLAKLSALQELDVEYNKLTGALPDLSPLSQLVQLGVGGNNLTSIHPSVCALPAVRGPACDMSGNAFRCPLPACGSFDIAKTCKATCRNESGSLLCPPALPLDLTVHRSFTPTGASRPEGNSTLYWSVSLQRSRNDMFSKADGSLLSTVTDPSGSGLGHSAHIGADGKCSCQTFAFTNQIRQYTYVGNPITNCTRLPDAPVAGTRARHWAVDAYESGHLVHYDYYTALDGPWPLRIVTDVGVQAFEPGGVKAGVPPVAAFAPQACCA